MDDDSSELSSLSSLSPAPPDLEEPENQPSGIRKFFQPVSKEDDEPTPKLKVKAGKSGTPNAAPSPPEPPATRRDRVASPPREPTFADNPDIAFIVMFRSRFTDAFPKSLQNFGPQELEKDVCDEIPGTRVENFLCAILGLLLNRKQDVKPGHYNRALEDALSGNKLQWPPAWEGKNPLAGQASFNSLAPSERLTLLRTLIIWSLAASDSIRNILATSYKQNRHNDDLNQPLSVQPWGIDSLKRRYYLIEGRDDTAFRVYREGNPANLYEREWVSVAGSLTELRELADKLDHVDGGPRAKKLSIQMMQAIPRFEATEEKRRRREYRLQQKERFKRPEPGFSLYEGRTRGKRIRYTYSDDEGDFESESTTTAAQRRSARNTGGANTPVEPTGPTVTASGRTIRKPGAATNPGSSSRAASVYSDRTQDAVGGEQLELGPNGRPRRAGANGWGEQPASAGGHYSEPDFGDDEEEDEEEEEEEDDGDEHIPDAESEEEDEEEFVDQDEEMLDEEDEEVEAAGARPKRSLVIKLPMPIRERESREELLETDKGLVAATAAATAAKEPVFAPIPTATAARATVSAGAAAPAMASAPATVGSVAEEQPASTTTTAGGGAENSPADR